MQGQWATGGAFDHYDHDLDTGPDTFGIAFAVLAGIRHQRTVQQDECKCSFSI